MKKLCSVVLTVCLVAGLHVFAVENEGVDMPPAQEMPAQGQTPPAGAKGEMPPWQMHEETEQVSKEPPQTGEQSVPEGEPAESNLVPRRNQPMGEMPWTTQNNQVSAEPTGILGFLKTYATPILSVVLLLGAFVFVKLYKRKL